MDSANFLLPFFSRVLFFVTFFFLSHSSVFNKIFVDLPALFGALNISQSQMLKRKPTVRFILCTPIYTALQHSSYKTFPLHADT